MEQLYVINNSQMTNKSWPVNSLGTPVYSDLFPGVWDGRMVLWARAFVSWDGTLAGTGALRYQAVSAPSEDQPTNATNYMYTRAASTQATGMTSSGSTSLYCIPTTTASDEWCDIASIITPTYTPLGPFPHLWAMRLANASGTFSAGVTLTLDKIVLYG